MREASSKNIARAGPSITVWHHQLVSSSTRVTCVESRPSCRQTSGSLDGPDGPDKRLLAQMHRFELDPHPSPSNACLSFLTWKFPSTVMKTFQQRPQTKVFSVAALFPNAVNDDGLVPSNGHLRVDQSRSRRAQQTDFHCVKLFTQNK